MSNVVNFPPSDQQSFEKPYKSGGGSDSGGGMEPRLARLEAQMEHVQSDMVELKGRIGNLEAISADIRVNVAQLAEKVSHLPSKGYGVAIACSIMAFVAALSLFGESLKTLLGL